MLDNLKNKINDMKIEAEKKKEEKRIEQERRKEEERIKEEQRREEIRRMKEEQERIEREKLEKERQRLLALNEKELLVEMMFMLKGIVNEQEKLREMVEECEGGVGSVQTEIYLINDRISSMQTDIDLLKYN